MGLRNVSQVAFRFVFGGERMQHRAYPPQNMKAKCQKAQAAGLSVVSNTVLVATKFVVGALSGSLSIIAEALHSGFDLVAAVIAWLSVRAADHPPDDKHPYGHGKLENLSGTIEAALILLTAVWIAREAWHRISNPMPVHASALALSVMALSAGVNVVVSRRLFRVAREENSIALEADAHHLSVDVYTSVGVFLGLLWIRLTGWHAMDGVIALGLAVAISRIAWDLMRRAAEPLMDTRLPKEAEASLIALIEAHPRVLDCHAVRSRTAGSQEFLDAHITVAPGTTLEEADLLEEELRALLRRENPRLDVMLHVEPAMQNDLPAPKDL